MVSQRILNPSETFPKPLLKLLVCLAFVLLGAQARGQETGAASLCDSLAKDLSFIHGQLQANSSPYNHDAAIRERTDRVFENVLSKAPDCRTKNDYTTAVLTYLAAFHDAHLYATHLPAVDRVSTNVWIRKLNDRYYVWNSTGESPYGLRRGDEWLSCAGRPPEDILIHDVLALRGYTALDAALYGYAADVFVRADKAKGEKIGCEFSQNGKTITKTLEWESFDEKSQKQFKEEVEKRPVYSISKEPWGYWVGLSDMWPETPADREAMQSFVGDAGKLRGAKTLVLDLRGNGGGWASWGYRWIDGLYGLSPEPEEEGSSCRLWASPENLRYFRDVNAEMLKRNPTDSADAKSHRAQIEWLSEDKKGFIDCAPPTLPEAKSREPRPLRYQGRLYVLTDAACFSSCEAFLTALRALPGVIHIGLPTNAMTIYSDEREVESPSHNAGVQFPQKVLDAPSRWKERKPGEALRPVIPLQYDPAQEARGQDSLRGAVLDLLKSDGRL